MARGEVLAVALAQADARESAEVVACAVAAALSVPPSSVEGEEAALALALASAL